ncbi:MAG: Uma2 family endonuclease, partial [Moorea sp. SIO2I5]|nr:Uma2 family endonuclease [Moorena sp. SIO2I5]
EVEEYYLFDPNRTKLKGWLRSAEKLEPIPQMLGWVSPRLGITFELVGSDLVLYYPNGEPFATYLEIIELKDIAQQQAEQERQRAEIERLEKEQERQRADQAEASLQALLEQLKAKGIDPEQFEL